MTEIKQRENDEIVGKLDMGIVIVRDDCFKRIFFSKLRVGFGEGINMDEIQNRIDSLSSLPLSHSVFLFSLSLSVFLLYFSFFSFCPFVLVLPFGAGNLSVSFPFKN